MYKCQASLSDKQLPNKSKASPNRREASQSSKESQDYLVSIKNGRLTLFSPHGEHKPIFQSNVRDLIVDLDSKSQLLTISSKKTGFILLKIRSDSRTLDDIEDFCHLYSDETLLWKPLVHSPHNTCKKAYLSDRTSTSSMNRLVRLLFDIFLHGIIYNHRSQF